MLFRRRWKCTSSFRNRCHRCLSFARHRLVCAFVNDSEKRNNKFHSVERWISNRPKLPTVLTRMARCDKANSPRWRAHSKFRSSAFENLMILFRIFSIDRHCHFAELTSDYFGTFILQFSIISSTDRMYSRKRLRAGRTLHTCWIRIKWIFTQSENENFEQNKQSIVRSKRTARHTASW